MIPGGFEFLAIKAQELVKFFSCRQCPALWIPQSLRCYWLGRGIILCKVDGARPHWLMIRLISEPGGTVKSVDEVPEAVELVSVLNRVFTELDKNHDGVLQLPELDAGIMRKCMSVEDAEAVAILKASFSKISALHHEGWFARRNGITLADLLLFEQLLVQEREAPHNSEFERIIDMTWSVYRRVRTLSGENRKLYATRDPLQSVKPEAIRQGIVGDCYFLAALGSIAAINPQMIPRMIHANDDRTFTVVFPGDRQASILVEEPSAVELALYAQFTRYGHWPAVLEKAYGRYLQGKSRGNTGIPQDATHVAQHVYEAFDLLTGQLGHWEYVPSKSDDEICSMLGAAFKERRASAAATYPAKTEFTPDGIPAAHAYSILAWDGRNHRITLRNPWGGARQAEPVGSDFRCLDGKDDGAFVMDLAQFRRNFIAMYYEDWLPSDGITD